MPKNISRQKLIKKLKSFGFTGPYSGGKHQFVEKGELKLHIPNKHSKDISGFLVNEILRQAGINKKEWDEK